MDSIEKRKVIYATNNDKKCNEVQKMFTEDSNIKIITLKEAGIVSDPEENGKTLEENAIIKAQSAWKQKIALNKNFEGIIIAEDFAFYVESHPEIAGIKSKRWLDGTDEDRNRKVLKILEGEKNRRCYYESCFAIITKDGIKVINEITEGIVAENICDCGGFAYDHIFIVNEEKYKGKYISELNEKEKAEISSRGKAIIKLKNIIEEYYKLS